MKGKILLVVSLVLVTGCAPRFARGSGNCTRQFLYTEYSTGRGGTLETHPVYGCAEKPQASVARATSRS